MLIVCKFDRNINMYGIQLIFNLHFKYKKNIVSQINNHPLQTYNNLAPKVNYTPLTTYQFLISLQISPNPTTERITTSFISTHKHKKAKCRHAHLSFHGSRKSKTCRGRGETMHHTLGRTTHGGTLTRDSVTILCVVYWRTSI